MSVCSLKRVKRFRYFRDFLICESSKSQDSPNEFRAWETFGLLIIYLERVTSEINVLRWKLAHNFSRHCTVNVLGIELEIFNNHKKTSIINGKGGFSTLFSVYLTKLERFKIPRKVQVSVWLWSCSKHSHLIAKWQNFLVGIVYFWKYR